MGFFEPNVTLERLGYIRGRKLPWYGAHGRPWQLVVERI